MWFAIRPPCLIVAVEHRSARPDEMDDGQGAKRDCSTTELRPDMVGATGVEPVTDNPCLRPIKVLAHGHKRKADKKAIVELPGVLRVAPPSQTTDRIRTGIAGFTRTHNLRPAENSS